MIKRLFISPLARRSRRICFQAVAVFSLSCICWLLASAAPIIVARQPDDVRELMPNAPIERELSTDETHSYKIILAAGTYLRLAITPQSIKIETKLYGPDSSTDIGVVHSAGEHEVRFVSLVAESTGSYRLEIRLADTAAKVGRYEVKIEERRPSAEQDRIRIATEKAESEGRLLVDFSSTAEQRRQGIAKFEEALALRRKVGDNNGELRTLIYLSVQHEKMGEPQRVLEYRKRAMEIARAAGDRYQEANMIVGLGATHMILGEHQKALDSFNQARQLFRDLSKKYGEAIAVRSIALTLIRLGEWQNALPYLEEALPTMSSVGDRNTEASILNMMGGVHRAQGDPQKAIEFFNRALAIARTGKAGVEEAVSLDLLGDTYLELGEKQKALDFFQQSLTKCRTLGRLACEGRNLRLIGAVAYSLGDNQKALDFLNQSLDLSRSTWERGEEVRTLHGLAQVNYSLGNFDEARKQIEAALDLQESSRANLISQRLRETFFTSAQSGFTLYIDLLMQLHKKDPTAGHEAAALQASERARARSLLELLSESQADVRQGVPKDLLELERSLQQQINAKAAARTRLLSDKRTQAQAASLDKEVAELTDRFREVEVEIRRSSPRYAALMQPSPLGLKEIQQRVLDDDTLLLEYALDKQRSYLWAVTTNSLHSFTLAGAGQIEAAARRLLDLLPKSTQRRYRREAQLAAAELSRLILKPAAGHLKKKRLLIVADGPLQYVPFAALPLPDSARGEETLLAGHEVISLPSASVLAELRGELSGRKTAERQFAVFADPVFQADDPRVRTAKAGSRETPGASAGALSQTSRALRALTRSAGEAGVERFERLPFVRQEADAITSLFPKQQQLKALDFAASRETVLGSQLDQYRVIHFATHGLLNSRHPELSGVVLSLVDENGQPRDGFLRLNDLYNLKLNADLVVLSACGTALGKEIRGEGLISLTRGFMYAGAARVVASLWNVNDAATTELMKRFYRAMLVEKLTPAAALRAAQLAMSRDPRWSAPYYWSGFVLQGEWK